MDMLREIGQFGVAVLSHWQAYVTGGTVTGIIAVTERLSGKSLPKKAYAAVFLGFFLLVSFFLAWDDEHHRADKLQASLDAKPPALIQVILPPITVPPAQVIITPGQSAPPSRSKSKPTNSAKPNSPAPENIELVSQENLSSNQPEFPYMLKVILQTHTVIQPVAFVFRCDGKIGSAVTGFGGEAVVMFVKDNNFIASVHGEPVGTNDVYVTKFESPAFSPERPMIVWLYSVEKIKMVSFQQIAYTIP
jgi:hypothetical protein